MATEQEDARWQRMMESDFNPTNHMGTLAPDGRTATAAEYAAYQLGQINRKLDRLTAIAERIAGK
jgi:hypothetical protein